MDIYRFYFEMVYRHPCPWLRNQLALQFLVQPTEA